MASSRFSEDLISTITGFIPVSISDISSTPREKKESYPSPSKQAERIRVLLSHYQQLQEKKDSKDGEQKEIKEEGGQVAQLLSKLQVRQLVTQVNSYKTKDKVNIPNLPSLLKQLTYKKESTSERTEKISTEQQSELAEWLAEIVEKESEEVDKKECTLERITEAAINQDYFSLKELLSLPHPKHSFRNFIWEKLIDKVIDHYEEVSRGGATHEIEPRILAGTFQKTILILLEYCLKGENQLLYQDPKKNALVFIKEKLSEISERDQLRKVQRIFKTYYQYRIYPQHFDEYLSGHEHWEKKWDGYSQCHAELLYAAAEQEDTDGFIYLYDCIQEQQKVDMEAADLEEGKSDPNKKYQVVDSLLIPILAVSITKMLNSVPNQFAKEFIKNQYLAMMSDEKSSAEIRQACPELKALKILRDSLYHYIKQDVTITKVSDLTDETVKKHLGNYIIHHHDLYYIDPDDGHKKEIKFKNEPFGRNHFYRNLYDLIQFKEKKDIDESHYENVITYLPDSFTMPKAELFTCTVSSTPKSDQTSHDKLINPTSLIAENTNHSPRSLEQERTNAGRIIAAMGVWVSAVRNPTKESQKKMDESIERIPTIGARNALKQGLCIAGVSLFALSLIVAITFITAGIGTGAFVTTAAVVYGLTYGAATTAPAVLLSAMYGYKKINDRYPFSTDCARGMYGLFAKSKNKEEHPPSIIEQIHQGVLAKAS